MAELHLWVGGEDPFRIPIGEVTLVIHQGTPPIAARPPIDNDGPPDDKSGPSDGSSRITEPLKDPTPGGGTYVLKDPTPGGGTYINLMREESDISVSEQIDWVLKSGMGTKVGIELPDVVVGGPIGRQDVFGPILDGLRTRPDSNLNVHLIRTSDLPLVDE